MAEETKAAPQPKFLKPVPREKMVALDHPFEFDGVVYESVRVKRCSAADVVDFMESLPDLKGVVVPPVVDMPAAAYAVMDDDDRERIEEASVDFLPRRLRTLLGLTLPSAE